MASIEIDTVQQSIVKHELNMAIRLRFDQENTQYSH
jgi:hypothetical protein